MRVTVLASGSSGNATLVEGSRGRILIDMGLSEREASRRLRLLGIEPGGIDAVLVSHEHGDHVAGAPLFSRKNGVPVYTTGATAAAAGLGMADLAALVTIETGRAFEIAGMRVHPFSVPHDAVDNVGYVVEEDGCRLGYATDLGYPSAVASERLRGCDVLVVEANHDLAMLRSGPYPAHVKQRVMGRAGHLSNDQAAELLSQSVTPATKTIFLAHLSERNNDGRLALEACRDALRTLGRDGVHLELTFQIRASRPAES
jgi:phosphoribosyl 1,2-cyclic phosphodiesterase